MGEKFLKSALPALDSLLDDSTLALPSEPRLKSPIRIEPNLRVQQQVRLTLERKTKKSLSNGNFDLFVCVCPFNMADKHVLITERSVW